MQPLVFQEEGQAMTTSLIVAREFGKAHKDVIRSINELQTSAQNCANLFQKSSYKDSYGRDQFMYLMNRDGFTLLAMGFTGERALEFKLKFLQAFNAMGEMLSSDEYILARSQQILKKLNDRLEQKIQMLEGQKELLVKENEILAPKAQYTDEVLQAKDTYTHTEMAKELNFRSWNVFIERCRKEGILFKHQGGMYMLYAKYAGKGYMKTRTNTFTHRDGTIGTSTIAVWTEKGRRFLHDYFNVGMQPVDMTMFNMEV